MAYHSKTTLGALRLMVLMRGSPQETSKAVVSEVDD